MQCWGRFLDIWTVAACLLHVSPPLAACGFTHCHKKFQVVGGYGAAFSPSSLPCWRWRPSWPATTKTHTTIDFTLFFLDLWSVLPSLWWRGSAAESVSMLLAVWGRWSRERGCRCVWSSREEEGLCAGRLKGYGSVRGSWRELAFRDQRVDVLS